MTVNTPACDCTLQPWDNGTGATQNAAVGATTEVTLPLPSVASNAYTIKPAMRSCTANSCATTGAFTTVTLTGGTALPGWITLKESNTKIDIAPTAGSVMASNPWVVVVVYTPTKGSNNPSYTAVTITVTCTVTGFSVSNPGTTSHTYNTWDNLKVISGATLTYTQTPACGYTFTNSFSYTIPTGATNAVSQGGYLTPSFNVATSDTSITGTFTLTITNSVTIGSGQGQTGTMTFGSLTQDYTLAITNPCLAATISAITFNPTSITVTDGATARAEFSIPTDSVDTANGITGLCGTKTYTVKDGATVITTYAKIQQSSTNAANFEIFVDPQQYGSHIDAQVVKSLTIETKFSSWSSNSGNT